MFGDSSTVAAIGRIKNSLAYSLQHKYGITDPVVIEKFLRIHGVHKDNFDFIKNVETLVSAGITDNSVDQNSNKNETTVAGVMKESTDSVSKMVGLRALYRELKEMYGKREAKRLCGDMYDLSLAISDSTKIMLPYCYAFDASRIVMEGRPFGQLPSAPPKRVISYIGALNETVHQMANHLAGAFAIGSFFLDVAHIIVYREGSSLSAVQQDLEYRSYIKNCFQNFVHSVNHLSRNSMESPFTNVSIFDTPKLQALIASDNMGWYFEKPTSHTTKSEEEWHEEVILLIKELQDIFMEFIDKGDPLNGGIPYRFPVCTINLSKEVDEKGHVHLVDEKFARKVARNEIYRYNILVSKGSKVASCCRLLSDSDMLDMGGQVNSFGGGGISLGSHRVLTINFNRIALEASSVDDYYSRLTTRVEDAAKILAAHKSLLNKEVEQGILPFVKSGHIRMDRMFSTFGVLGIVEAEKTLQRRFDFQEDSPDFIGASLELLNTEVSKLSKEYKIIGNIEQIPAETMAVKLRNADAMLFGEEVSEYPLYANQFIPLWKKATIAERMRADGRYNKKFTGGGIVHFNLGERITSTQAYNLIKEAAESGCEHFALNSMYSKCRGGHSTFGNHEKCPVCGEQVIEKYTRVVGFMTPITSWNEVRREWESPRRPFQGIDE